MKYTLEQWKDEANKVYMSHQKLKIYKKLIKSNRYLAQMEQKWVDNNLAPIIDFMGEEDIWTTLIPDINLIGLCTRKGRSECSGTSAFPRAHFSGSHWISCKPFESKWFNPYDHYQVAGTNQFCQTFSMMYLLDKLPTKIPSSSSSSEWTRNYMYTIDALRFIQGVIVKLEKTYDMKKLTKSINECLTHPNICFNALEF